MLREQKERFIRQGGTWHVYSQTEPTSENTGKEQHKPEAACVSDVTTSWNGSSYEARNRQGPMNEDADIGYFKL